ncbi:MAG: hypothetical protein MJ196_04875 [Treponemataceae bacterium]|nr:hypothetical protein [Treponemataceae bacterium]
MKSICKVLALCLCFGLVITMCACKGGGGGSSSSSSTAQWTTGNTVAKYSATDVSGQQAHYFVFQSDGVVGFYDAIKDNVTGRPVKIGSWDTKTQDPKSGGFEFTIDGTKKTVTSGEFKYTCEHGEKTYKK